jgi:glycosyltransferase involved in cell wall biosynthesis
MRVLQVIETGGPGGAETVVARLSSGLVARGHAVQCVVANGTWLPGELVRRGLPVALLPRGGGALDRALLAFLRAQIRAHGAEVVHAHLFEGALYAGVAARLEGVPCVATLHGQVDVPRAGLRATVKQFVFRRAVTRVVSVSEALRTELRPAIGIADDRFVMIPNGVPVPPWAPRSRSATATPRVIAIGNIRKPKDYPTLLSAMALLRARVPGVCLDVVGQSDREGLFEALQAQASSLGLGDAVSFHGFVSNPGALLAAADCFVLASSQEGFSLATIEAMLAGVPVVATRSGGPEEILRDGETGALVPVRDPLALATALERVLGGDPAEIERLRSAARTEAALRYSEGAMVAAYEALYNELLA